MIFLRDLTVKGGKELGNFRGKPVWFFGVCCLFSPEGGGAGFRMFEHRGRVERQKECDLAETKDLEEMDQEPRAGLADLVRRGYLGGS